MIIDLSGVEKDLIEIAALGLSSALSAVGIWVLKELGQKLSAQKQAVLRAAMDDIAAKGISFAVMQSQDLIKEKGWDHADVQNVLVGGATNYLAQKFPDTLAKAGIDPNTPQGVKDIEDFVTRALPAGVAAAAASPTTPDTK